jgi:hypothetical protein
MTAGIATNFLGAERPPVAPESSSNGAIATEESATPVPASDTHPPFESNGGRRFASRRAAVREIFAYGFRDLLDETAHWLVLGVSLATLVAVLLPASMIERYFGGGFLTMLAMLLIGIPTYTCASASTPIAAALVLKGLSPGAALVFLLSGPATNIGTIVMLLKFLGPRVVTIYLLSIAGVALAAGYALDWIYVAWQINPVATFGKATGFVPEPMKVASAVVMLVLLARSLWRTPVPEEWTRVRDWVGAVTGLRLTAARLRAAVGIAIVVLYLGSGLFTVQPGEVAVRTRFGRIVDNHLGPGCTRDCPGPSRITWSSPPITSDGSRSASAAPPGLPRDPAPGLGGHGLRGAHRGRGSVLVPEGESLRRVLPADRATRTSSTWPSPPSTR